jgi:toxin secretion/phage lysis holin
VHALLAFYGREGGNMKNVVCTIIGVVGGFVTTLLGGWDLGLQTLVIFMVIDYISGLVIAGIFKKSDKTKSGGLDSNIGWKGLAKKCMTLLFILIAYRLDLMAGTNYIRTSVIIAFSANELISITENAGIMGLPVPKVIIDAIEVLKNKGEVR